MVRERSRLKGRVAAALLVAAMAGGGPAAAETPPSGEGRSYPVQGRMWSEARLRQSYESVWRGYVVDASSRMILPLAARNGFVVFGEIESIVAGRRLVVATPERRLSVQVDNVNRWRKGDRFERVVVPSGTPLWSYEPGPDQRESLPNLVDATLTFEAFVVSLQRGQHYPEAPELGTKAERKGLFRTERVQRNVVEDR